MSSATTAAAKIDRDIYSDNTGDNSNNDNGNDNENENHKLTMTMILTLAMTKITTMRAGRTEPKFEARGKWGMSMTMKMTRAMQWHLQ